MLKLLAAIVQAHVVVIPDGQMRNGFAELRKTWLRRLSGIRLRQLVQLPWLAVGIHGVAPKNEQIGSIGQDGLPYGLLFVLVDARAKCDFLDVRRPSRCRISQSCHRLVAAGACTKARQQSAVERSLKQLTTVHGDFVLWRI